MKMGSLEKRLVNRKGHSRHVADRAERLLQHTDAEAGQAYLDVGCGNGAAPIRVAGRHGLWVTGADVDPDQIRLAEEASQHLADARFVTANATDLPFEDEAFDIVSTAKATHHIPNWEKALAEMVRVLKPGGYLIYVDLVAPGWVARIGETLAGNRAGFPTARGLASIVEQQGLTVVYESKTGLMVEKVWRK